jgi:hypothetical protein
MQRLGRLVLLWSVGFMGADSRAGEEQRKGLTSVFRNDSTFIVSGSSGPVSKKSPVCRAFSERHGDVAGLFRCGRLASLVQIREQGKSKGVLLEGTTE